LLPIHRSLVRGVPHGPLRTERLAHAGANTLEDDADGSQLFRDGINVRLVSLDGSLRAPRGCQPHEEFELAASVVVGLQVHDQHPVTGDQAQRPAFSAFPAQYLALIITGVDAADQRTDSRPLGLDVRKLERRAGDHSQILKFTIQGAPVVPAVALQNCRAATTGPVVL